MKRISIILGICVGTMLTISGCDYVVNKKWIYINETNHVITCEPSPQRGEFYISGQDTLIYYVEGIGPKHVDPNELTPPVDGNVIIDNEFSDSVLTRKVRNVSEYECKILMENNFEFTFRFTEQNVGSDVNQK